MKCDKSRAVNLSDSLYCKQHPTERGNYFCLSCRTIVCTLCIVNEHADHQAVEMTSLIRQQQQDVQALRDVVQARNETLRKRLAQLEALRQASKYIPGDRSCCVRGSRPIPLNGMVLVY